MLIIGTRNVFVPGETIPVEVKYHNGTKKRVDATKIDLFRRVDVMANGAFSCCNEKISREVFAGCEPNQSAHFTANIRIPENIYPSTHSDLVRSRYYLRVDGDVKMAFDIKIEEDVVVALLPAPTDVVTIFNNYQGGANYWKQF